MKEEQIRLYLNGLMNMASSLSSSIGPSYIMVDCYKKTRFKKESNINEIIPTTLSFSEKLKEWFGEDKKTIESILYWTKSKIKEKIKIYEIDSKEYEKIEKYTPFYIIDDIFVLETKQYMILYILGNNE